MEGEVAAFTRRLKKLSSSVISDVLDAAGLPNQVLSNRIAPLAPSMRFAGPAACFSGSTLAQSRTASGGAPLSPYEIDTRASAGEVAVIATNGHAVSAVVGGLMALGFARKEIAALVIEGGVRDVPEILEMGLATFCTYVTPMNSANRWALTEVGAKVSLPGQASDTVAIEPGDYLVGDADGVIVIPKAIVAQVLSWGEHLAAIEEHIVSRIRAGDTREEAFKANPRFAHIQRIRS